jgi:hypothetical protein
MISEIRPPNPAFARAGQAALQAMISLARNPATAEERVSDRATEIGRAALAALTPERCAPDCPFCAALISNQRMVTRCFLGLRLLAMDRCPLHPVEQPAEDRRLKTEGTAAVAAAEDRRLKAEGVVPSALSLQPSASSPSAPPGGAQ